MISLSHFLQQALSLISINLAHVILTKRNFLSNLDKYSLMSPIGHYG